MAAPNEQKKPKRRLNLREDIFFQPKGIESKQSDGVGVLEDVKLLGWNSRNKNRRYMPEGVNPAMYEGKEVYVDHPDPEDQKKPRSVKDKLGWVEGIYKTKEGLFAKRFKYDPNHETAKKLEFWARERPESVGFSQNAFGDVYEGADGELVEEVTEVRSIDLVSDPATTKGLFEAYDETEKGMGHTGYEGGPEAAPSGSNKDKTQLAPSSPGPSSVKPVEKLVLEDDDTDEDDFEDEDDDDTNDEKPGEKNDADANDDGKIDEEEMSVMDDDDDEDDPIVADGAPGAVAGTEDGDKGPSDETAEMADAVGDPSADEGGADISGEMISAASKIFGNAKLDVKTKLKMIAKLLELHHYKLEESMKIDDLPTAKKTLRGLAKKHKLVSAKMVLEALDEKEVAEALRARKVKAKQLIKAASLPKEAITEGFLEELLECRDERRMQVKIEDRRKLVSLISSKQPTSASADAAALLEAASLNERRPKPAARLTEKEADENFAAFENAVFAGAEDR